jgi:hypothetical protein
VRECSASPENFHATCCEVLTERVENAATTIRNNRGMLERMAKSFCRRLHYCIDNNDGHFKHLIIIIIRFYFSPKKKKKLLVMVSDYSNYFMRIFTD